MRVLILGLLLAFGGSNPGLDIVRHDRELSAAIRAYNKAHKEWAAAANLWVARELKTRQEFKTGVVDVRQLQNEAQIKAAGERLVQQAELLRKATRKLVKSWNRLEAKR